jgi:hypothetical protein
MKIQLCRKALAILIVGLFFAGAAQIGFSTSVQKIKPAPQSTMQTSFDPFIEGWTYRKQITIHHTNIHEDITNFPVLISIVDNDLKEKAQPDGDDILFMDNTGFATLLYYEIEQYDGTSGTLIAWVNIAHLSSSEDTVFYMYYGNSTSLSQQNPEKTWDANYVAVWHFGESAGSTVADSTSNTITGTANAGASISKGFIGNARNFDGSTGSVNLGTSPLLGGMPTYTVEAWVNPTSISGEKRIYDRGQSGNPNRVLFFQDSGKFRFQTNNADNLEKPGVLSVGTWYYLVGTFIGSGGEIALYADGIKIATTTSTQAGPTPGNIHAYIGDSAIISSRKWYGKIDELRFSKTARTPGWINTTYQNQNSPATFLTPGPEETIPFKTTIMFGRITDLNTVGNFITFNAVNLRSIRFSPFSFNFYKSNERFVVSKQYHGLISPKLVLTMCEAYP